MEVADRALERISKKENCFAAMVYKKAELDKALPPVSDSRKSVRTHPNRKKYWNALLKEQKTFEELYEFVEKSFLQKVTGVIINLVERLFNQNK